MNLSKNFTLEEMIVSQEATRAGIRNFPTQTEIANLRALCENILQPLRDSLRRPVVISSGFRSRDLNVLIGGSLRSQHCRGEAADLIVPGMTVEAVVQKIRALDLPFDKVIDEFGAWVHVSHGPRHRRQALRARRHPGGKTSFQEI